MDFPRLLRTSPSSATGSAAGGTFTLNDITWPAVAGLASYVLFVGTQPDLICAQATGTLTAGSGSTYTPGSITFGGPVLRSTWSLPSPYVSKIRIKAKRLIHAGIAGVLVDSVNAPNQIVCGELIDLSSSPFSPVGRIVSVIGRQGSSIPYVSVTITASDPTTGTLTVAPQAVVSGHPELSVQAGDVIVIRNKADAANTGNETQITDSGYMNSTDNYTGLVPGIEVGNILRVIQGTGRGQLRRITGNTATQLSWDFPLLLDTTSVWIVEAPTWDYTGDSTTINNALPLSATSLSIPTGNFLDESLLIAGFTVDVNGNESPDGDGPIREVWLYGAQGTRIVTANSTVLPTDGTIQVDTTAGNVTVTLPDPGTMLNQSVLIQKISPDTNIVTITGGVTGYSLTQQWAWVVVRGSV